MKNETCQLENFLIKAFFYENKKVKTRKQTCYWTDNWLVVNPYY